MRSLARRVGLDKDQVERFVRDSPWDPDAVQDQLRRTIPTKIQDPKAVLVWDDFGIAKQGKHSVGAYRQYSGVLGKTGNCQVAVNLTYAAPGTIRNADQKTWPLGTLLYLPQEWVEGDDYADLRAEVHIPEDIEFETKHELAWTLYEKAKAAGVTARAITGDAEYGKDAEIRRRLRQDEQPYVLAIQPSHTRFIDPKVPLSEPGRHDVVHYPKGTRVETAKQVAKRVRRWTTVQWAQGVKGPLTGRFARIRIRVTERALQDRRATHEEGWLLLEQRKNELKAYVCWGLDDASLEELVEIAHLRWTIEHYHKEAKQILGLDRFEGRTWMGWNHHVAVVLLAYAFLATLRAQHDPDHGPLPPLADVAQALVEEFTAQEILRHHTLTKQDARAIAKTSVRVLWGRPSNRGQ
jgi:SRSO17 transposase